jgi:hypothetical protein
VASILTCSHSSNHHHRSINHCRNIGIIVSGIKLSHTAKELYLKSPRAYFYHYHLYIREARVGSALFFGSIIEKGLEALFNGATLEEAQKVFRDNFKTTTVNGNLVNLATSPFVRFSKADFDEDVFTEQELKDLEGKTVQFQSHASLQRKGEMMIAAYYRDILPKIKKIIATQVPIALDNGNGDFITGSADLIVEWEDGRLILPDHKTSSLKYPDDAFATDQYGKQTALYYEALKDKYPLDGVGFFVMEKKIRKKDPRARAYAVIGSPPEELIEQTFQEFDEVLTGIKQAEFPCMAPKCDAYGQQCCYRKFCESGGTDMTGLVKVGRSK